MLMGVNRNEVLSLVADSKYHNIIEEKLDMLENGFRSQVELILSYNDDISRQEEIYCGGKVAWLYPRKTFFKVPLRLMIDAKNLRDTEFVAVFLHECGHLADHKDLDIPFRSGISELSAWNHALMFFKSVEPTNEELDLFFHKAKSSLITYDIDVHSIVEISDRSNELFMMATQLVSEDK
jgi:hypothetical protein